MRGIRLLALIVAAIAAIGLLAGAPSAHAQEADPLPPELREWLDDHGALRVGWAAVLRPVSIVEDGEVTGGYAVDAWDLAALRLGVELEHVAYADVGSLGEALDSGDIDVAGGLGLNPTVAEGRRPSEPYAWVPGVFVGRQEQVSLGVDDLTDRTLTMLPGAQIREAVMNEHPGGTFVSTDSPVVGLQAVADGEIDLYFGPLALLGHQISRLDLDLVPIGERGEISTVQSWADRGSEAAALADEIRGALSRSDLALLHIRWTGFDLTEPRGRSLPTWLLPAGLVAVGALLILLLLFLVERRGNRRLAAAHTELSATSAELERVNREFQRSNADLEQFAYVASHDLKEPLRMVNIFVSKLQDRLGEDLDEKSQKYMDFAQDGALRMDELIDALLRFSRAGRTEPEFTTVAIEPLVASVCQALSATIEDSHAVVHVGDDLPSVDADPTLLAEVLQNLISNSLKYVANDQRPEVRVGATASNGHVAITVSDNGIGIDPAQRDKVFEMFHRLHTRRDYPGTGIGLALVQRLVEAQRGTVTLGDRPDGQQGSQFVVTLGAAQDPT